MNEVVCIPIGNLIGIFLAFCVLANGVRIEAKDRERKRVRKALNDLYEEYEKKGNTDAQLAMIRAKLSI